MQVIPPTVAEAKAAARAGMDIIVAQETVGGGHIGLMGTMPLGDPARW